jgi:hypothetical protein
MRERESLEHCWRRTKFEPLMSSPSPFASRTTVNFSKRNWPSVAAKRSGLSFGKRFKLSSSAAS